MSASGHQRGHAQRREDTSPLAAAVSDGETIIMDTGSTIAALAGLIPRTLTDIAIVTTPWQLRRNWPSIPARR